jgi:hypothetical protein
MQADSQAQSIRGLELDLIAQFKEDFYGLCFTYESLDFIREKQTLLRQLAQAAEIRYSTGEGIQQDIIRASTEILILENRTVAWEQKKLTLNAQILALVNRPPDADLSRPEPITDLPALESFDSVQSHALETSPMLGAQRALIDNQQLNVQAAQKAYYPDFDVMGGYYNQGVLKPMWEFKVQVNITLYFWKKQRSGLEEAVATLAGAQREYRSQEQTLNASLRARLIEFSGAEYMVRGHGYIKRPEDIEQIVLKTNGRGTPVLLQDVARVERGPEIRRGVVDLDGMGDAVAGIVVMRQGKNADQVIRSVKEKLSELEPSFPKGVKAVTTYDRSDLIERSIKNLKEELVLEIIIVSLVILIFLWHIPSAIIPIVTIPVSALLAFIPMRLFGLNSNIMSLAGIAISIGVLVDGAIVEVENAYKKLELWIKGGRQGDFHAVRLQALKEVGPSVFFSLLVIAVEFLPVFTLVDQGGRLFRPFAFTKNSVMAIAAILAVTLDPTCRKSKRSAAASKSC